MICEWNELVECEVSLPSMVIMNRGSYSWTDQNRKTRLLFMDGGVADFFFFYVLTLPVFSLLISQYLEQMNPSFSFSASSSLQSSTCKTMYAIMQNYKLPYMVNLRGKQSDL